MKKKLFALILSILFLSGCTSEYNITIDEDLKITEEITVLGDERFGITGNYNEESLFNILTNTYEEFYNKENVSNYNKWTELGNIASSYKNEYSNFDDWKNSFYVNKFFPDMSITTDEDNIVNINSSLIDSFWLFVPGMEEDALVE